MSKYSVSHYIELDQIPESFYLFLHQNPIINFEILQSIGELKENPGKYGDLLECIIIEKKGIIQVVTFRIPPYNVMISHARELDAVSAIVEYISNKNIQIPGIFGPSEVTTLFVEEWENLNL